MAGLKIETIKSEDGKLSRKLLEEKYSHYDNEYMTVPKRSIYQIQQSLEKFIQRRNLAKYMILQGKWPISFHRWSKTCPRTSKRKM